MLAFAGPAFDYLAGPGESNDVVLSPGVPFASIQDDPGVTQIPAAPWVASDFLGGIGIDVSFSVGVASEDPGPQFDVGVGIGWPLIPFQLPDGVLGPPTVTSGISANDLIGSAVANAMGGVASAVAGVPTTADGNVAYQVEAAGSKLLGYRVYQAVVDPAYSLTETESNDTAGTADSISSRRVINGSLSSDTDRDVFAFSTGLFQFGDQRQISVIVDNDPDKDGNLTGTKVSILARDGSSTAPPEVVASNVTFGDANAVGPVDVGGFASTVVIPGAPPWGSVDVFVLVEKSGTGTDDDYRFVLLQTEPSSDQVSESEPNDTLGSADALGANDFGQGTVPSTLDYDFWASTRARASIGNRAIETGDLVFAYVDTVTASALPPKQSEADSMVTVFNSSGAQIAQDDDDGPAMPVATFDDILGEIGSLVDLDALLSAFSGPILVSLLDGDDRGDLSRVNTANLVTLLGGAHDDELLPPGGGSLATPHIVSGARGADVIVQNPTFASFILLDPAGMDTDFDRLVVNDDDGDDQVTLKMNGGNLEITVNGTVATYVSIADRDLQGIYIEPGDGDDSVTIDSSGGAIPIPVSVLGDNGTDRVTFSGGTATSNSLAIGVGGSGTSTMLIGGVTQVVNFEGMDPIFDEIIDDVDGPLTVHATQFPDSINLAAGNAANRSKLTIINEATIQFANKTALAIHAKEGDDVVDVQSGAERGFAAGSNGSRVITVNGQDGEDLVRIAAGLLPLIGTVLNGGANNDQLFGGSGGDVLNGGDGDDLLDGGLSLNNSLNSYDGRAGVDTILVQGTDLDDTIAATQGANSTNLWSVNGSANRFDVFDNVEQYRVDAKGGDDDVRLTINEPLTASIPYVVDGGPNNGADVLTFVDVGAGDLIIHRQGPDDQSGTLYPDALGPISYEQIENVEFTPQDPVTGGTGSDGAGLVVVLDEDPFEMNDSLVNATDFGALASAQHNPVIDVGGDEDWYHFRAPKIGTFSFHVLFERVARLPGGGELQARVYREDGSLIASSVDVPDGDVVSFSAAREEDYFLRVEGAGAAVINVYDVQLVEVDLVGPQVYDPDGSGPLQPIQITDDPTFDLFNPKPSGGGSGDQDPQGPTPLVHSITINLRDVLNRMDHLPADLLARPVPNGRAPGDLYPALDALVASMAGHIEVRGDANGVIPIQEIIVSNQTPVVDQIATATVEVVFFEPLPDDRFTLTIFETLIDPAGNALDGENNAAEPQETHVYPTGDDVAGGDFVARFTVDSRAEIGTWSAGSVYVDTNGNFLFDPQNLDYINRDIVYTLGFTSDDVFAGNFQSPIAQAPADGFDKLAAYGEVGGVYRWLVDTTNDGVANLVTTQGTGEAFNGLPVAGDFDGDPTNGDEVALFTGTHWLFDADRDFVAETWATSAETGLPIVGDFDGDGSEDLGLWRDDQFFLSLSTQGGGVPQALGGASTITTTFNFGFIGVRERPVAADMDGDGMDDLGLWVPDRSGALPEAIGEWYFLISDERSIDERLVPADPRDPTGPQTVEFTPVPFGEDLYAQWGDEFAIPVVGNFDPPVTGADVESGPGLVRLTGTAGDDTLEVAPGPTVGSWGVTFNGAWQNVEADTLTVTFDGLGGSDTVIVVGGIGDDVARLWPGHGAVAGDGYSVAISNVETVSVEGGDVAFLRDNPAGKDTLTGGPDGVTFAGDGYSNRVASFRYVHVYGTAGQADAAQLQGAPGVQDTFEAWPDRAKLEGDGYLIRTNQISYVSVEGQPDDVDVALLHDDPEAADTFEGRPDVATLSGAAFSIQANSFPYVHAYGTAGSGDVARFYDNPDGFDKLVARPDQTRLFGEGFLLRAKAFGRVRAWSTAGTGDLALLHDASTDDTFTAWPDRAELFGPEFDFRVNAFGYVHAYATGGADAATLYGSAGRDVFVGTDRFGKLRGSGYFNRAVSFEQIEVHGGGGRDVAVLRDAVLESGVTEPLDTTQLAWLYEFERIRQRSDSGESIVDATDEIFTAYWQ